MRRKDKYIVNGILWGSGLAAGFDILNQWIEHKNKGIEFNWKNFNGVRTLKLVTLGGFTGGGIGYLVYCYKLSEEEKLPFNSEEYLKKILEQEHLKANQIYFKEVVAYRDWLKLWIIDKFGYKLAAFPEDSGSITGKSGVIDHPSPI